jgi:hypothetical protein
VRYFVFKTTRPLNPQQQRLLEVYTKVNCPITIILATKAAGKEKTEHTKRINKLWREGGERLASKYPSITMKWLDAGYRLPLTKPAELAKVIDDFAQHIKSG